MSSSVPVRGTTTFNGVQIRGHRPVRPGLVVTVFCLGLFMTLLDITIVNIAIPDLVTDLDATFETVLWVTSAYSLVYTVMLIVFGRLGDIVGPRRMFLLGISLFTAGQPGVRPRPEPEPAGRLPCAAGCRCGDARAAGPAR